MTEPTLTDTLFDVDGNRIGYGIFLSEIEEDANHKLEDYQQGQKLIQLMEEELKKCDEDYNRYEEPVGWQNIPITGQIESLLQSLLDQSKGDKE